MIWGTKNMSDDELRKYIDDGQTTRMVECVDGNPEENGMLMFSDLEQVQVGLENCFGTGETFDVTGVPEECFRLAGVLENTLMKSIKPVNRQ